MKGRAELGAWDLEKFKSRSQHTRGTGSAWVQRRFQTRIRRRKASKVHPRELASLMTGLLPCNTLKLTQMGKERNAVETLLETRKGKSASHRGNIFP